MYEEYEVYSSRQELARSGGVERYPLNFDALRQGMKIPVEEVGRILGMAPSENRMFHLKVLGLQNKIDREMRNRGHLWTYRIDHGSIVICTDSDAAEHNARDFRLRFRAAGRAHARNAAVDTRQLSAEKRETHERTLLVQGRMLQAARTVRSTLQVQASVRKTPGLLGAAGN